MDKEAVVHIYNICYNVCNIYNIYLYISLYIHLYTHTHTHTHTMEYYSAIKKNEILPFAATWMGLENIIQSEVSQTEKDKYDIIYMWI